MDTRSKTNFFFLVLIVLSFCAANFPMLMNFGCFWDDWVLYNQDPKMLEFTFLKVAGAVFWGKMHAFLNGTSNPPLIYHLITFFSQLAGLLILFKIFFFTKMN